GVPDLAAQQHLVAGCGPPVGTALDADEPDVGDVVLAARVRAPRDVHPHAADVSEARALEGLPDVVGQAPGLGDGEVAGVGARDWVPAGVQGSAAGPPTASRAGSAPGSAIPTSASRACRSGSCSSVRPRRAKFCRLVTRTSNPKSRCMSARARNWSEVMSPR